MLRLHGDAFCTHLYSPRQSRSRSPRTAHRSIRGCSTKSLRRHGIAPSSTKNRIEADHGQLKRRLRPVGGLKTDRGATVAIRGHALVQNIRRGHYELAVDQPANRRRGSILRSTPARSAAGRCSALRDGRRRATDPHRVRKRPPQYGPGSMLRCHSHVSVTDCPGRCRVDDSPRGRADATPAGMYPSVPRHCGMLCSWMVLRIPLD